MDPCVPEVQILLEHGGRGVAEGDSETLFVPDELRFRGLSLGDVENESDQAPFSTLHNELRLGKEPPN